METKREKQVRVLTALHDIMPALRDYAAVAAALGLAGDQKEALDAAVLRLYRAGYAAGRRARPTDETVLDAG